MKRTGTFTISFTGYVLCCYAQAINENKPMNAYRKGRQNLMVFDDVDVAVMVEKEIEGQLQPIHYILRAANKKSLEEINLELLQQKDII